MSLYVGLTSICPSGTLLIVLEMVLERKKTVPFFSLGRFGFLLEDLKIE